MSESEISTLCWCDAKAYWEAFQHGLNRIKEGDTGATVTREQLGRIYQETFIETYCKVAFAKLYDRENALVAADPGLLFYYPLPYPY